MLATSQKTRPLHLLSKLYRTIWGSANTGGVYETGPPGASHSETIWDADFEGTPGADSLLEQIYILGQKIKLRGLGRNAFLRCTFETFKPRILVIAGWASQDQGSYPQEEVE